MTASMTIRITEDDSPHGCVEIDYDVKGFEIENARVNGDLPPSLLLGARLLQVVERELPSAGGRPAPSKHANLPTRHHGLTPSWLRLRRPPPKTKMTSTSSVIIDRIGNVIELLDTIFGFARRFRPRSESAPGPLEPGIAG